MRPMQVQKGRKRLLSTGAAVLVLGGLGLWTYAETGSKSAAATPEAETKLNAKQIEEKLDEILAVQANVLREFDDVMEDLRIIKVRVSR